MPVHPSADVAPTARVHPDAVIGPRAVIGAFAVVEQDVVIGAETRIEPYVYVKRWTTLGEKNEISAGTVLGTDPLDKNFSGARSYLKIGNGNTIREHYTVSRGTAPESETVIGDENYIMTSGHIAHNCRIGNRTVIASCSLVAGYVGGGSGVHFRRCGYSSVFQDQALAMVGGSVRGGKSGCAAVFSVRRAVRHSEGVEPRGPAPRGPRTGGHSSAESRLQAPLQVRTEARRRAETHRDQSRPSIRATWWPSSARANGESAASSMRQLAFTSRFPIFSP